MARRMRLAELVGRAGTAACALSLAIGVSATKPALAASLDAETCATLAGERDVLARDGAMDNMKRGPEWAQSHLTAAQIEQIKQLLAVQEKLLFQCPQPATVAVATADSAPDTDAGMPPLPGRKPQLTEAQKAALRTAVQKAPPSPAADKPRSAGMPVLPVRKGSPPSSDPPTGAASRSSSPAEPAPAAGEPAR